MKTLRAGIASFEEMRARTMRIVRGEEAVSDDSPKMWFTSIESFARVLSDDNRELLCVIGERSPQSIEELAEMTGRAKSNLSRTLKRMEGLGLVCLTKGEGRRIAPRLLHDRIELQLPLSRCARQSQGVMAPANVSQDRGSQGN